jgi:ABC-2 type transport system permease protein
MSVFLALLWITVRGLLGRRRLLLMLGLAAVPVLLGVLVQLQGGRPDVSRVLGILVVQTVMPIVALILGTATLGSEIEDGTAVFVLVKPIPRWVIALSKLVVATVATDLIVVPVTLLTGILVGGFGSAAMTTTVAFAVASLAGGAAYAAVFVALSSLTARALVAGLVYVLLWEGSLGGLLDGTRFLSIRQATLGIAAGLGGEVRTVPIDAGVAVVVLIVVIVASLTVTSLRLVSFELRGGGE